MENNSYNCRFCESKIPVVNSTYNCTFLTFDGDVVFMGNSTTGQKGYKNPRQGSYSPKEVAPKEELGVHFYKCPSCEKISVEIVGVGEQFSEKKVSFFPDSNAKQYPNYIPSLIREDYEEACKILNLSPKASATLSRRCLQGMIRDFHKISKKTLFDEIEAIETLISPQVSKVLHAVRQIGNIGAHMEKDINTIIEIEPSEANQLIQLIEYLMQEWYINQYETDKLLNDIIGTNSSKQAQRQV